MLEPARCTLCFNWLDPTATTSRYPEALSIGMVPFVWRDYDKDNTYNIDPFQRVKTFEELQGKIRSLQEGDGKGHDQTNKLVERYRENYAKVLLSEKEYFDQFSNMMDDYI